MNVTLRGKTEHFRTVTFDAKNNSVRLIEQRLLPHEFKIVGTKDFRATARALSCDGAEYASPVNGSTTVVSGLVVINPPMAPLT